MSPFETALGERFHLLPPQVRQLHGNRAPLWRGQVSVEVSKNPAAKAITRFAGFPASMEKAPFALRLSKSKDGGEVWQRDFDGVTTVSTLRVLSDGRLQEHFGSVSLIMVPSVKVDSLRCEVTQARLFGKITLPRWLVPYSDVKIWQDEAGRYRFDIRGIFPMLGEVIRYHGWLLPGA